MMLEKIAWRRGLWFVIIHSSLVLSLRSRAGRNQSPVKWPVWLWHTASWAGSWGVVCHCFPPPLDVPTFAARCLYVRNDLRDPSSERWNSGREIFPVILPKFQLPHKFRDLLHAANLRHGMTALLPLRRKACWGFFFLELYEKNVLISFTLKQLTKRIFFSLLFLQWIIKKKNSSEMAHNSYEGDK